MLSDFSQGDVSSSLFTPRGALTTDHRNHPIMDLLALQVHHPESPPSMSEDSQELHMWVPCTVFRQLHLLSSASFCSSCDPVGSGKFPESLSLPLSLQDGMF